MPPSQLLLEFGQALNDYHTEAHIEQTDLSYSKWANIGSNLPYELISPSGH